MPEEKTTPLTQDAFDRLKAEREFLEGEGRQSIIEAIATARAHGDLSENAEYHAAKDQQGMQEARVRQLRQMLESAEIVKGDDSGVAKPGMLVTIKYQDDDETETYFLGLREEKGGEFDVLTPESPIGKALLGRSAGEAVVAEVPSGALKVQIVDVRSP
ncbi:MAG: transcription elongation factor GreA [Actinomycetota bacterium]|nr:transcription elongation factor GreA [Actinomycetota bacterium]